MSRLTYKEQLNHPKWQRRRLERLEAAGWQCKDCSAVDEQLHVHHERYIAGRMVWEYDDDLLTVLCHQCHAARHRPVGRRKGGRVSNGTANALDRVFWVLFNRCANWLTLPEDDRALLCEQPDPYGPVFTCFRNVEDLDALAGQSALDEFTHALLNASARSSELLSRFCDFLPPEPDLDLQREMTLLCSKLRLQAIEDEMKTLFDAGVSSPDAQRRSLELMNARRALKAAPESRRDA